MYHIGYYYHQPSSSNKSNALILGFTDSVLQFYQVDKTKIPTKYLNLTRSYYDLSLPVLFSVCDNVIDKVKYRHLSNQVIVVVHFLIKMVIL